MRLLVAMLLVVSTLARAEVTYTYTGAAFTSASGTYDTTMRIIGSFVVADELDDTTRLYPVEPLRYSFSDGSQSFDETNSELTLNVSVQGGQLQYWYLEVSNYPRPDNTDLADRGWLISTTNNNGGDDAFYRPCDPAEIASSGTCREIYNRASSDTGVTGSWAMTGSGLPTGQNTILGYEGPVFTNGLTGTFYSGSDRVSGTVKIAGLVTPGAWYADQAYGAEINDDIVEFSFTDGINTFDENNSHPCTSTPNRRLNIKFDENGEIEQWGICLTTKNADNSFQFEYGTIASKGGSAAQDSGYHYECHEVAPSGDSCATGAGAIGSVSSPYSVAGNWSITPPDPGEQLDSADLLVRCVHQPLWPEDGQEVTIRAEAINGNGDPVQADLVEIYTADPAVPEGTKSGGSELDFVMIPAGSRFRYGCRVQRGEDAVFSGWRETDVGTPELSFLHAVPVIYTGDSDEKIDVVFMPEANRHGDAATGWQTFLDDVYMAIHEGLYGIPWFVKNQEHFNFWLALDQGEVTRNLLGLCERHKPAGFKFNYAFADTIGLLHREDCRDNVSPTAWRVFTTYMNTAKLQVVSHEIGHSVFKLSDEYVGSSSIFFTIPKYPNLFPNESACNSAAIDRGLDPEKCRHLASSGAKGAFLVGNWIFEPDYRIDSAPWTEVRDLMQQTGGEGECVLSDGLRQIPAEGITGPPIPCYDRYQVGDSETARMEWKLQKCRAGRC